MAYPSVSDLLLILTAYFPRELSLQRMLYALGGILSLHTLVRLNQNQRQHPHQPPQTGWEKELAHLVRQSFLPEGDSIAEWEGDPPADQAINHAVEGLNDFLNVLNWDAADVAHKFAITPPVLICTSYLNCKFCPPSTPLFRQEPGVVTVPVLGSDLRWTKGRLVVAACRQCHAIYHADHITRPRSPNSSTRIQYLKCHAAYLRISKTESLWVSRQVSKVQESATFRFKASWQGFSDFLNRAFLSETLPLSDKQMHKLFVENMARRLIISHHLKDAFTCSPDPSADHLVDALLAHIGHNRGQVPGAMDHVCQDCAHQKRYHGDDSVDDAIDHTPAHSLAEVDPVGENALPLNPAPGESGNPAADVPPIAPPIFVHQPAPPLGTPHDWVRMAVMDGKTLSHRICGVHCCRKPLVDYKSGRFCEEHLPLVDICGMEGCNLPVAEVGSVTCSLAAHVSFHRAWQNRFGRANFQGVRRGIKKNAPWNPEEEEGVDPEANPGHTFRARRNYCVQTVQWACGFPIGWGKCYEIESLPQVLALINFWFPADFPRPQFICYDSACRLLAHIVTQNPHDLWLLTTRFVVDAWHYINHRSTDTLCREWCNPAPLNGTQPDLVILEQDGHGHTRACHAFNTETAEQFNAWMDGFESQLRQMTDYNFDFVLHSVMLLYQEDIDARIEAKGRWID